MIRLMIKLQDDTFINIPADEMDVRGDYIVAWSGEMIVAVVKLDNIKVCYLSEQKC